MMRRERGQTAAEYVGVLLVVASIIAALVASQPGHAIADGVQSAVCKMIGGDDCGGSARPPGATKEDRDGDGIPNEEERRTGLNPDSADSDQDGVPDGKEVVNGTDPRLADTDGDGLDDRQESGGKLDPTKADTDGDGLTDGEEVAIGTDPTSKDSDGFDTPGDGLTDLEELNLGSDPNNFDSDGDGNPDGYEVAKGDDPTDDERGILQKGFETFVLDDPISLFIPTGAIGKVVGKGTEKLALEAKAAYTALRGAKTLKEAAAARRKLLALFRERFGSAKAPEPPSPGGGGKKPPPGGGPKKPPPDVDVWALKPTDRGVAIEREIAKSEYRLDDGWWNVGATKGGTSELIDFQRGPIVLSLKTLDPRLKYAGKDLPDHIRKLGARDIRVDGNAATKVLDIRVPPGHGQDASVQKLVGIGRANNVQVRITEYPR
jgi:hypothetical protein